MEVGEDDTEREDFEGLLVLLLPLRLNNSSSCTMLCAKKEKKSFENYYIDLDFLINYLLHTFFSDL